MSATIQLDGDGTPARVGALKEAHGATKSLASLLETQTPRTFTDIVHSALDPNQSNNRHYSPPDPGFIGQGHSFFPSRNTLEKADQSRAASEPYFSNMASFWTH